MYGMPLGSESLKITRPTVVLIDLALELLELGVHHVLVVVDGGQVDQLARVEQADRRERLDLLVLERDHHVLGASERAALALGAVLLLGQVVAAEHDVLARDRDRLAVRRREDVVRATASAPLASICASGDSGTCTAIWSPSKSALNAVQTSGWILIALPSTSTGSKAWMPEAVERRRAVQQHRVLADDLLEDVPHLGPLLLDHLLRRLMVATSPSFSSLL